MRHTELNASPSALPGPLIRAPEDADPRILRELRAVREIAHAFLMAARPLDVYQFALDRVTPILGAAFSLIMQLGDDGELLRPIAQHEWPARHRSWIGALRVRVGDGPSGVAVETRELVEVTDIFADPALEAWYPVAEELGFRSIVAAPLIGATGPVGAIAFYFTDPTPVSDEQRALVRLVAEQLAATAEKARLIDALRRSNGALAEANEALEREVQSADGARRTRDQFVTMLLRQVSETIGDDDAEDLEVRFAAAHATARAAAELAAIECGAWQPQIDDVDPRAPLVDAVLEWRSTLLSVPMTHGEPTVLLPTMRSDADAMRRLLSLAVGQAIQRHDGHDVIHLDVELGRGFVAHRLEWSGAPFPDVAQPITALFGASPVREAKHPRITSLDVALLSAYVRRLGGDIQRDVPREDSAEQGITLVFPVDDAGG